MRFHLSEYKEKLCKWIHSKKEDSTKFNAENLLRVETAPFAVVEAYSTARTNILYLGFSEKGRVIVVSSASANEGKSLTCTNLAVSFAQGGKRVLVIDGDMRNPTQSFSFSHLSSEEISFQKEGLSEYLAELSEEPLIQQTTLPNVDLLVAGNCPPDPSALTGSQRMEELLKTVGEKYDVVLLDMPPIGLVPDAIAVARYVAGYILVVKSGSSEPKNVKNAIAALERVDGKILGLVLNGVVAKRGKYRSYYYHYYDKKESKE